MDSCHKFIDPFFLAVKLINDIFQFEWDIWFLDFILFFIFGIVF